MSNRYEGEGSVGVASYTYTSTSSSHPSTSLSSPSPRPTLRNSPFQPPTSPFISHQPPSTPTSFTGRAAAFFKHPLRARASATSLNSSLSATPSATHFPDPPSSNHPFATMVAAPVPVVSSHDAEDEKECPVCLEPLSFSFRLPGEKPHIVPDCGHALHEVRFSFFMLHHSSLHPYFFRSTISV